MQKFFEQVWQMIVAGNLPGIIGAVLVLLAGWFIALWLSHKATAGIRACMELRHRLSGGENISLPDNTGRFAGRITYWIVMILALLAAMSLLKLEYAAVPLREFVSVIVGYLPNIAGALLLWAVARIIAGGVRMAVGKYVNREELQEQLSKKFPSAKNNIQEYAADSAAFLVYLFFLPAILNALGIFGITAPLQAMFGVILIYLPRIAAALVVFFAGMWAAKIARKAVAGAVMLSRVDVLGKWCGFKDFSPELPARFLGCVAWILVVIPVMIGALTALGIEMLSAPVSAFFELLLAGAGNIIAAVLVLIAAAVIAKIVARGAETLAQHAGMDKLMQHAGVDNERFAEFKLSSVTGKIAGLCVIVLGILGACELLYLDSIAAVIHRFAVFGGNLILSVIILLAGAVLADFAAGICRDKLGKVLTFAVKSAVLVFAAAIALSNLNTGEVIVETAFAMILGALSVAFALAFGLGGREFAAGMLEKWQNKH
ncbi:MAG: hypothetical protein E7057_08910 [Lentisphaerae bacterium]|nr:hypothetical protein [Lentisphaerota bacterium]